ncbi:hypothetical protein ADK87_19615 [Streptomyces sp. NRRL F-4711]|nr:hypothetical protein ADK87_19615 [Streptomyces sp. NRRL F-4711]
MVLFVGGRVQQGLLRGWTARPDAASQLRGRGGGAVAVVQDAGCAGQYVFGTVEREQSLDLRCQRPKAFLFVLS